MNPESIDIVDQQVEEAEMALEEAQQTALETHVENAEAAATVAGHVAADAHVRIDDVQTELENHEESDQWLKTRLGELSTRMDSWDSRLSTLHNLVEKLVEQNQPPQEAPPEEVITETATLETPTEILNETPTEAPAKSEEENPAPESLPEQPKRRGPRMI